MESKIFELRAPATFMVLMATKMRATAEAERYLLARAGYGKTYEDQGNYFLVQDVNGGVHEGTTDPYKQSVNEIRTAHQFIIKHFDELDPGEVIDIEFILGMSKEPKTPERLQSIWWGEEEHSNGV